MDLVDRAEERGVDRREHDDAVARLRVQPQRGLDCLHHVAEDANVLWRPGASRDGAPATARRPRAVRSRGQVVAEVPAIDQRADGVDATGAGGQVHVGDPGGKDVGVVPRPLDAGEERRRSRSAEEYAGRAVFGIGSVA